MNRDTHTILNEKYRPQTLDTFVGNEAVKDSLQRSLETGDIQHMLFYGPPGTGKSTLAKLIVKNINCDYIYINASDERGIETIRDKVSSFASTASFKQVKVVILDEADFLTLPAQASLRNVIETFSVHTRFILTCNYVERIIDALQSRCKVIKISPPSKKEVANHLQWVMDEENTEATIEDIVTMVNSFYPDMRKLLDTIQFYTKDGKLNIDSKSLVSSNYMLTIVEELKKKNPNFKNIRTAIINSGTNDFEGLYKYLFDNASEFAKSREGSVMVILNEHLYQSNFVVDKEICVSACLYKIIEAIKPQTI